MSAGLGVCCSKSDGCWGTPCPPLGGEAEFWIKLLPTARPFPSGQDPGGRFSGPPPRFPALSGLI